MGWPYSQVPISTPKHRNRFQGDEPTVEEAAEAYQTLDTAGGTYEISGTKMVLHRVVNRNPNWTGADVRWDLELDGDLMKLGPNVWRRIE